MCLSLTAPCLLHILDADNPEYFTVLSETGASAATILKGSGSSYFPALDSNKNTQIVIETNLTQGAENLIDFSFIVRGGVTVTLEIYGVNGNKFFWNEVYLFCIHDLLSLNLWVVFHLI